MQEETKKLIRTAVRNVLKNTDLTEYRIRKIVKGELEDPGSWLHPGHEEDAEWCIANYYRNLTGNSVFDSFVSRLAEKYQINYFNHLNKQTKEETMKKTKKTNTIALAGNISEVDRAAMGLTMDDFFGAVREIREEGVPFLNEETCEPFLVKVNMEELARHDPDCFDPGESLEATLYGVFEAIHLQDPKHRGCETRSYFDEHWAYLTHDRKMKKYPPEFIAYRALVNALTRWLHAVMKPMLEKEIENLKGESGNRKQVKN